MAKGICGKRIPQLKDIVKIDGSLVFDKDGDAFERKLVVMLDALDLSGYEIVTEADLDGVAEDSAKLEDQ